MVDEQTRTSGLDQAQPQVLHLDVRGMHCTNCAALVEHRLEQLPQVRRVKVDYRSRRAEVAHVGGLDLTDLQSAVTDDGFTLSIADGAARPTNAMRDYLEIAAAFAVLTALVLVARSFNLIPRGLSVSDSASFGMALVIGLVASVSSCIAVTGGLLLAVAARFNASNTHLSGLERMRPHLYFNAGRLVSYALLGGVVGGLGAALMISPEAAGALTLIASAVMIMLGLQMLGLFPSLGRLMPALPQPIVQRIRSLTTSNSSGTAFMLGGLTFFLPCGFTQALQLYVLAKGEVLTGALTMLAFAIGTLPALLSLSAVSSFTKGAAQSAFLKFAGAAVILLGVVNIQSGLALTGLGGEPAPAAQRLQASTPLQQTATGGPQRISMKVVGLDYQPNQFTVKQGVPVQWWIDGSEADGCGRVLLVPKLGIEKLLSANSTTLITFIPNQPGDYAFNCGMGMMTPGSKITVLPKDKG